MGACSTCSAALPAEARFCPSCGAAQQGAGPVVEERKLATVLFADLVGSTAHAHAEDPERVRVLLDRFAAAMTEEIERTGGTVEKFAGDGVMAAFGAPAALEDHAERALHAALAMQRRLAEVFEGSLQLRIGVNTGDVVVGQALESSSFVTGDPVNVGKRLEQAARPGEVLAGERTVAAARGAFEFGEAQVVQAKGKPDGVVAHPVLRALELARPRGAYGLGKVFVGRDRELDLLHSTFRRAVGQRETHLVTVVGEPGVGKSRLVQELGERLQEESPDSLHRTGRCLPYGDGITYWPLGEALREHYGIADGDPPEEAIGKLAGREILGLALGLDVGGSLHPLDARERLHANVVGFFEELATERPVVLLIEDIHWAEDDFLDLLERLAREARAPLVLLTTARPELFDRRQTWSGGRRNATTLWLEPLPIEVAAQMLDGLVGIELPRELRELVVSRSEGNPFFVEELVGSLVDASVLELGSAGWTVGDADPDFTVPDTVHAVLAARMDRLAPREKAALQAASVVGRTFWRAPVVHLLGGEAPDFDLLEERDFIRRIASTGSRGETRYAVKHALTREVAYLGIPKARRGQLHAALAEWFEGLDTARDEQAPLLAYHYSQAVNPEDADLAWSDDLPELQRLRAKAVVWLLRAADLARGRYEMEDAVELYMRAVALSGDGHEQALLWRKIGEAHALRYDGEGMRVALLRALEGPLDDDERAETYAFLAFQASIRSAMWSIRLNRDLIADWVEHALAHSAEGSRTEVQALLAQVNIEPGVVSDELLTRVVERAEAVGDLSLRSYSFGARNQAAFERRQFHEAASWSERRLLMIEAIDDPDHHCEAYESGVPAAVAVGDFAEARRLAGLHVEVSRRLSAHHRVHGASLELELADAIGDWQSVAAATDAISDAIFQNLSTPCVRNPRGLLLCAAAHLCLGDEERARALERDGLRIAGEGYDAYLSEPRLRLALERGDREAARSLALLTPERSFVWGPAVLSTRLDAMIALGERDWIEREATLLAIPGTLVEPFALRALGYARADDDLLSRADARFEELGLGWHAAQTERLLAGV